MRYLIIIFFCLSLFFHANSYAAYPAPIAAKNGMVVSVQPLATHIGVEILKQGGNAIDAAVAMGYALAVVYPAAGNLGGGGFMTLRLSDGKEIFINFREKAPLAATANMYLDKKGNIVPERSLKGYLAVAVPGTVMGLNVALQRYGTLPLAKVMAPAIKLAEEGYLLNRDDTQILKGSADAFKKQTNVAAIFLKEDKPYLPGERLIQKKLANTLKKIAQQGNEVFYKGAIADAIVKASDENGGILSHKDFTDYTVQILNPLRCTYKNYEIVTASLPSSGGITLCEMLNIVENYPLAFLGFHSAKSIHYLVEAMRYAYYDRNNKLGDPDFVKNPTEELISKEYAIKIRKKISDFYATPSDELTGDAPLEGTNTTHYSVVDHMGNAVAVTYTLNGRFGAHVIAGDTGFFLNNEMDDFSVKAGSANMFHLVQGASNNIQPAKRPLSSMAPTIVLKEGKLFMVLGSPGGSAIPTALLQTFLNVVEYKMDIKSAINSPRIHFQWKPDQIWEETFALSYETKEKLAAMGYKFMQPISLLGIVEAILIEPMDHILYGASDDRIPMGEASGY